MKNKVDAKKVIVLVVLVLLIVSIFFLTRPKNCKTDESCFNLKASTCSKAYVTTQNNLDTYKYQVLGKKTNTCIVEVSLLQVSDTKAVELKQALEGRSMTCAIPREMLQEQTIKEIKSLNDYCTGPLKEAMLELSLNKIYEIVIKNIGPLTTEFKNYLEKL